MDSESKSIRQIAVDTWLEKPDKNVTLAVTFQSLPDGTNYAAETVLLIPGDEIEVRIENSNYQKLAPQSTAAIIEPASILTFAGQIAVNTGPLSVGTGAMTKLTMPTVLFLIVAPGSAREPTAGP
jgi:hypothetical protein